MRVVFFGDSLTEAAQGASYLRLLRDWAASDARLVDVELVNAGVSGDTVRNLIRRVGRDVVDRAPDAVVIYIGVNDVATLPLRRSLPTYARLRTLRYFAREKGIKGPVTSAAYGDGLRILVDALAARTDARVALCTPAPYGESLSAPAWRVFEQYASAARHVANARGCDLVDLHAAFARALAPLPPRPLGQRVRDLAREQPLLWRLLREPSPSECDALAQARGYAYTYDGIHFNTRGAQLVANALYDWLLTFAPVAPVAPAETDAAHRRDLPPSARS
jgi:lysophospholipase L1-like esterase